MSALTGNLFLRYNLRNHGKIKLAECRAVQNAGAQPRRKYGSQPIQTSYLALKSHEGRKKKYSWIMCTMSLLYELDVVVCCQILKIPLQPIKESST